MPQHSESLHRGISLPSGGLTEPVFEQPKLRVQPTVLISEPRQLSHLLPSGDGALQEQQSLLPSRLGTQHHGSHDQGNSGSEDLDGNTLHKKRQRPEAPPKGPIW
jgi:hypothetical protein